MRKFFKIFFWSLGTPVGYLGSLSQDPLGRIFSKCAFLNLLALPLPSNVLGSSKKLKFFPRGCDYRFALEADRFFPNKKQITAKIYVSAQTWADEGSGYDQSIPAPDRTEDSPPWDVDLAVQLEGCQKGETQQRRVNHKLGRIEVLICRPGFCASL